ncbi:MAG TPA: hypothetical protein DFK21_03230 [Salmonella bongori]|uniref:Uncharacterized protein n=1 Tax=Salmonella bongori serovar 66:z41:- str. SA19983605 TaxID=1243617 RepID=A0A248K7Z8_SALBN|nr:hypothetical protein LFZ56_08590 [Salmonella bongori serovar 66:z41:- str. SA19983605]ECC9754137.1 hypothetical protein [Salmonella bongori]QGF76946.1 hypothetical protein GH767_12730 [Salmonella bongori CFSAN000510]HAD92859.1 hypothetical protein [Salmonella bongori]HBD13850.1 hypothetical protein [Salmonella bongori]
MPSALTAVCIVYTRLKVIVKFVVILVVLTTLIFRFSLQISQLMAKAIPVRGARFRKACF